MNNQPYSEADRSIAPYLYHGLVTGRSELKRPSTVPKPQPDPTLTCDHAWERFKKRINSDNAAFNFVAFFVVKACRKCQKVQYLDYCVRKV